MNAQPPPHGRGIPPNTVPLLGQQQAQARAGILQAVQQLSLQIYTHLATNYVGTRDRPHEQVDSSHLQLLARESHVAAKAYFEGLGIAQFQEPTPPAQ